jgi:hypothetical protein
MSVMRIARILVSMAHARRQVPARVRVAVT